MMRVTITEKKLNARGVKLQQCTVFTFLIKHDAEIQNNGALKDRSQSSLS